MFLQSAHGVDVKFVSEQEFVAQSKGHHRMCFDILAISAKASKVYFEAKVDPLIVESAIEAFGFNNVKLSEAARAA